MDQVIELLVFYWEGWQQTATGNALYSIVLSVFSFLMGGAVIAFFKRIKIVRLNRQVTERKQQLEKIEQECEKLVAKEKNNETQIITIQQKLEQVTKNLQHERDENQIKLSEKDVLFIESANKKQQEMDALHTMLDEKASLADCLQNDLNEQEKNRNQYKESQGKIVEMEKLVNQYSSDLDMTKKQLKAELKTKNEQIAQSTQDYRDKILELELQLKETGHTNEAEKIERSLINQKSEKAPLLEKEQQLELEATELSGVNETVEQQSSFMSSDKGQQQEKYVDSLVQETKMEVDDLVNIEKPSQQEDFQATVSNQPIQTQKSHAEPLEQKMTLDSELNDEKQGVVGQVLGWFSSIDNVLETNDKIENKLEPIETVGIERERLIKEKNDSIVEISNDEENSFSEKLVEFADTMDALPNKFKKLYRKVIK